MRYLTPLIETFLTDYRKMVFIAGPRQVGKTTLAKSFLSSGDGHFNWDIEDDRKAILKDPTGFWLQNFPQAERLMLDEIHKYPRWKKFLKGLYDKIGKELELIVTGSGRLNVYQKGGDSLFGRYYLTRLHPFSVGEMLRPQALALPRPRQAIQNIYENAGHSQAREALEAIDRFTGFPEPLFSGREETLVLWRRSHRQLIIREDLRDLTRIRDIGLIEAMIQHLPDRIGSPLSLNALREDLGVAFGTVQGWLTSLSHLYFLFEIRPFSGKLSRTLKREGKVYLFEGTQIEKEGARFENLMALHLKKAAEAWSDWGFGDYELYYVRDKEKREVDFLITENKKPFVLVECKSSGLDLDNSLSYFRERLKAPYAFQVMRNFPQDIIHRKSEQVTFCSAERFLAALP
ncbi:MAG TPA: hypothetical protein DF383_10865 [Deltaproteobacteria bacterium]|nr:hypothetical protein [Deltaproteobacteria bacterium]